jgi:hypothetical protein
MLQGQRNASWERRSRVSRRQRDGRSLLDPVRGGVEEAPAINAEADPNLFSFGPDGRIYLKVTQNSPRSESVSIPYREGRQRRLNTQVLRHQPRARTSNENGVGNRRPHQEMQHEILYDDFASRYEYDLSLAIQLSLSTLDPSDEAPLRPARDNVPPPDLSVDESTNPNLFCIGSDGTIRRKANRDDPSPNFEDESLLYGVTWLRDPSELLLTPPPRRIARRMTHRHSAHASPATVVWQNDQEPGRQQRPRHATPARDPRRLTKKQTSNLPPPLPPPLIPPFCIEDPAEKAFQDLLASRTAVIATAQPAPRFDPNHMTFENLLLLDSAPLSAAERAKKGLSVEQLRTIHSVLIQTDSLSSPQCSICQEDFKRSDPGLCLPHCQHVFHGECLGPWLADHSICPNCRRSVV